MPPSGFAYTTHLGRKTFVELARGGYDMYHFPVPARTFTSMRVNPPRFSRSLATICCGESLSPPLLAIPGISTTLPSIRAVLAPYSVFTVSTALIFGQSPWHTWMVPSAVEHAAIRVSGSNLWCPRVALDSKRHGLLVDASDFSAPTTGSKQANGRPERNPELFAYWRMGDD